MIQYQDCIIENETFVLDSRDEVYYLGHNLTLKNCKLIIKVPWKGLVVAKTRLIGCSIEVSRVLKEFGWDSAILRDCKFKGRFVGCDFGSTPLRPEDGAISNCDFTEARLDWCRFVGCDVSCLRFPLWPCVTILDTVHRIDELRGINWPGSTGLLVKIFEHDFQETKAITFDAQKFAEKSDTTPEAFKAALQGLGGVIL